MQMDAAGVNLSSKEDQKDKEKKRNKNQ